MHTCLLSRQDTFELSNDSFRNICDLLYNPYDTERLHFIFIVCVCVFFFSKLYHVWKNTKCECDLIMPVFFFCMGVILGVLLYEKGVD